MRELERSIARLSLLLAEVQAREAELARLARELEAQRARGTSHAVQGSIGLEGYLSIVEEVEERAAAVERKRRHLAEVRDRAQSEMASLLLLQSIDRMRAEMAEIEARVQRGDLSQGQAETEMNSLRRRIEELSARAAQPHRGQGQD